MSANAAPAGLQPFDLIEDLDLVPLRDHIVMQRVTIQHGSIVVADAAGKVKKGSEPNPQDFFGLVLAVGPGRIDAASGTGEPPRRPMSVKVGDYVRADGRLMFHFTPGHRKVFIATEDVVVGILKPETKVLA